MVRFVQDYRTCELRMRFVRGGGRLSWTSTVVDPDGKVHDLPYGNASIRGNGPKRQDWLTYARNRCGLSNISWFRAKVEGDPDSPDGLVVSAPALVKWGPSPEQQARNLHRILAGLMGQISRMQVLPRDGACKVCFPHEDRGADPDWICPFHEAEALLAERPYTPGSAPP